MPTRCASRSPGSWSDTPRPEVDIALTGGEVDGRANIADTILRRSPEYFEKNLVDFHTIINIPKANKHARFAHLPELDSLVKSENDRKLV